MQSAELTTSYITGTNRSGTRQPPGKGTQSVLRFIEHFVELLKVVVGGRPPPEVVYPIASFLLPHQDPRHKDGIVRRLAEEFDPDSGGDRL